MKLRKCLEHGYTFEEKCKTCGKETKSAHYKFLEFEKEENKLEFNQLTN